MTSTPWTFFANRPPTLVEAIANLPFIEGRTDTEVLAWVAESSFEILLHMEIFQVEGLADDRRSSVATEVGNLRMSSSKLSMSTPAPRKPNAIKDEPQDIIFIEDDSDLSSS
ncbi:hypothetical protein E8E13_002182 [Curvularia kusanoi]|uniref:Uncharacterized protein n=1 Tax=Curvularia kusanoi TaxID=90978 RepID=A0A9P4T3Z2_CURKU|nr:hypothetical protein E8E13_002182 [Curvularia kusanoi]